MKNDKKIQQFSDGLRVSFVEVKTYRKINMVIFGISNKELAKEDEWVYISRFKFTDGKEYGNAFIISDLVENKKKNEQTIDMIFKNNKETINLLYEKA